MGIPCCTSQKNMFKQMMLKHSVGHASTCYKLNHCFLFGSYVKHCKTNVLCSYEKRYETKCFAVVSYAEHCKSMCSLNGFSTKLDKPCLLRVGAYTNHCNTNDGFLCFSCAELHQTTVFFSWCLCKTRTTMICVCCSCAKRYKTKCFLCFLCQIL